MIKYLSTYKEIRKVLKIKDSMVAIEISGTETYVFAIKSDFKKMMRERGANREGPLDYNGDPTTFSWYSDQKILYVNGGI